MSRSKVKFLKIIFKVKIVGKKDLEDATFMVEEYKRLNWFRFTDTVQSCTR